MDISFYCPKFFISLLKITVVSQTGAPFEDNSLFTQKLLIPSIIVLEWDKKLEATWLPDNFPVVACLHIKVGKKSSDSINRTFRRRLVRIITQMERNKLSDAYRRAAVNRGRVSPEVKLLCNSSGEPSREVSTKFHREPKLEYSENSDDIRTAAGHNGSLFPRLSLSSRPAELSN